MNFFKKNNSGLKHVLKHVDITPVTEHFDFLIENNSNEPRKWVLGGSSRFLHENNFGSGPEVKIETFGYQKYPAFLQDLATEPIHILKFRVYSETEVNLKQDLTLVGNFMCKSYSSRIEVSKYFDKFQYQQDIIDVNQELKLDKNYHLEGNIQGNSKIRIGFFVQVEEGGFENAPFAFASKHSPNTLKVTPRETENEKLNFFQKIKRLFQRKKTIL